MEIRWLLNTVITFTIYLMKFTNLTNCLNQNSENTNLKKIYTKLEISNKNFSEFQNITNINSLDKKIFNENNEFIDELSKQPHSRKKRLIWITDDGRLALPPGTALSITPSITMPLVRYPPEGFLSNISISFPVTIDFDKLGLTDNQNPLGDIPPLFARSFGRTAGKMLGNYVSSYLNYRTKRDTLQQNSPKIENNNFKINIENKDNHQLPVLPEKYKHIFHGGERALLYGTIEDLLSTFGVNGKACLLRTICEIHSRSIEHFGFFGEAIKLFLTASKSPFANYIKEYVKAEHIGKGTEGPGECFPYYKLCPKSIFNHIANNKYSNNSDEILTDNMQDTVDFDNDIEDEQTIKKLPRNMSM